MSSGTDCGCTPDDAPCAHDASVLAVVGAGAAGTLTAIHLLRELRGRRTRTAIVLIDPADEAGRGVAYSTTDDRHLLNVPAGHLGAFADDNDHFVRWARCQVDPDTTNADFLPRRSFGDYLASTLDSEARRSSSSRLVRRRARAVSLEAAPAGRELVRLSDGDTVLADGVVLASGVFSPGTGWAPAPLRNVSCFVADPWAPGALDAVTRSGGDVLLVGTGLTMVDVALSVHRAGRTVHAVSRSGRLPRPHAAHPVSAVEPAVLPSEVDLDISTLRRAVEGHVRDTVRTHGDWRPAIDGLRPHISRLWSALCHACRAEFVSEDAKRWDVHRHRMPFRTAAQVARLRATGELRVTRGEVTAVDDDGGDVVAHLSDGSSRRVSHVVNCTGPQVDVRLVADPLLAGLIGDDRAVPGALGMGLATDREGRVRAADSSVSRLWTIGAMRRGELWESTAVPEIRAQAVSIARQLAAATAPGRVLPGRAPRDVLGLTLSTNAAAAESYNRGLARVLRVQDGADEAFREAAAIDPDFALAHAALALLGHEGGATTDVATSLAAARRAISRGGDDRERGFVDVVSARVLDCQGRGEAALVRHVREHPRDALAVSAAVPTIAFSGVTDVQQECWDLVESLAPAYGADWWYAGLLAFVRQDQKRYDEAASLAESSLQAEPASGQAVHANTHVYYETGQHAAGLRWLDPWIATSGRAASHRAHFSWHAALHELALGDREALRRRYERELAPPHVAGVRALVDSASLLWRCRLTGSWSGHLPVEAVLDLVGPELLQRPTTPFTAMHAALALTAAGDVQGLQLLRGHVTESRDPVMCDVLASLCDALLAVVEGRWTEAVRVLRLLGPWLVQLGGSAAQREIVEDTLLYALVEAERFDEARRLLQARLDRRPSPLDLRRLAGVSA